ncbi:MAG: 2-hydroxyacyl-CoA dehydratase family protein [Rhodocyclaceae bacterium]|nr:2-hydroxyacyl-CoA dehydratase family protein [Rhodocyclaceae bacterium]
MNAILERLAGVAQNPYEYVKAWKQEHGGRAVGTLPMHCPAEVIHAAGVLPVVLQELADPITSGGGAFFPFFCGYTRSLVDQATEGKLDFLDAISFTDHCVQLLSAADVMRIARPQIRIHFHQLIAALDEACSLENSVGILHSMATDLEETLGVTITEDDLRASIRLFNENRQLIRSIYDMRRSGSIRLRATQMQHIVKSSMIMDKQEHNALLRELLPQLQQAGKPPRDALPMYASGHLCHAPRPEILDLIEDCGIAIIDDDLYHGYRYVSTDVDESIGDPILGIATAYLNKNDNAPCPTRLAPHTDWNIWLRDKVTECGAKGLIVLLAKYCEPHYFHYPRIKATFESNNIPHLLIETEHEGIAMENLRTKVESFAEITKRRQ